MNWKQHESEDVIVHAGLHEGDGAVTRRRFFHGASKLPVRIEVWELPPGASEGRSMFTRGTTRLRSSTTSSQVGERCGWTMKSSLSRQAMR